MTAIILTCILKLPTESDDDLEQDLMFEGTVYERPHKEVEGE